MKNIENQNPSAPPQERLELELEKTIENLANVICRKREENPKVSIHDRFKEVMEQGSIPETALESLTKELEFFEKESKITLDAVKETGNEKAIKIVKKSQERLLSKLADNFINSAENSFKDERFNIPNFKYLKEELFRIVDNVFENGIESIEDLQKTAVLFFDIDGLKSVNDNMGGHEAGDKYIERAANIFKEGKTVKWAKEAGITVVPARRSGDELMIVVSSERFLVSTKINFTGIDEEEVKEETVADYIVEKIREEFRQVDMTDIEDLSKQENRDKYNKDLEKAGLEWPEEEVIFRGSISGGASDLLGAILSLKEKISNIDEVTYRSLISLITGKMFSEADKVMNENKETDQEARRGGKSKAERILEVIYRSSRTGKEKEMQEQIDELTKQNLALLRQVEEIEGRLGG